MRVLRARKALLPVLEADMPEESVSQQSEGRWRGHLSHDYAIVGLGFRAMPFMYKPGGREK